MFLHRTFILLTTWFSYYCCQMNNIIYTLYNSLYQFKIIYCIFNCQFMFYRTLNLLSQLTQHIIEQIKILDQLTSYKLTNFYRGALRGAPKSNHFYSLKPKDKLYCSSPVFSSKIPLSRSKEASCRLPLICSLALAKPNGLICDRSDGIRRRILSIDP